MPGCHRWWSRLLAVLGLWAGVSPALAGSFVEHLTPPFLARGKTSRITLVGSELGGATGLWTSLPVQDVTARLVEPSRGDRAAFEVRVDPEAPLGLYGLRLATRTGLSNVK